MLYGKEVSQLCRLHHECKGLQDTQQRDRKNLRVPVQFRPCSMYPLHPDKRIQGFCGRNGSAKGADYEKEIAGQRFMPARSDCTVARPAACGAGGCMGDGRRLCVTGLCRAQRNAAERNSPAVARTGCGRAQQTRLGGVLEGAGRMPQVAAGHKKMGKLLISHRYDHIPLLDSSPGGFCGSWSYKTYPRQK